MFILRDLLPPLQAHFSDTDLGRERASLFAYTLLAIIVPFTSSGRFTIKTMTAFAAMSFCVFWPIIFNGIWSNV